LAPRRAPPRSAARRAPPGGALTGLRHGANIGPWDSSTAAAQRLALAQWRLAMGCAPSHPADTWLADAWSADTRDTGGMGDAGDAGGAGGAVVGAVTRRVVLSEGGAEYGREVPRPHADAEAWRRGGRGRWPHLRFVERAVVAREVRSSPMLSPRLTPMLSPRLTPRRTPMLAPSR